MINQLQQPVNPALQQMGGQGDYLIQENQQDMTEEEFAELQAALVASMNQENEDINIDDDDEEGQENPGMVQQMMGMFGFGAQNQDENGDEQNGNNGEDGPKKEEGD